VQEVRLNVLFLGDMLTWTMTKPPASGRPHPIGSDSVVPSQCDLVLRENGRVDGQNCVVIEIRGGPNGVPEVVCPVS
jgi:hypothetical protein